MLDATIGDQHNAYRRFHPIVCIIRGQKHDEFGVNMKEFPPFRLDNVNQCLWRMDTGDDERISLTPKAFGVLQYLVEHCGRLVTHDELLNALWPDTFVQPEVLKSHILAVRTALGDHPKNPRFIDTLPRRGYQFIAPVKDVAMTRELTVEHPSRRKLVGRNSALAELKTRLERSVQNRQFVFVTGEPGIGKTTLVDEFLRRAGTDFPGVRAARGQCVEGYGGKEAYYPILEALSQLCTDSGGDEVVRILSTQAPTWLVQFPALVNSRQREILHREILGATRERMLREIGEALETIASEKPLVLVLEDMHWADPSSVDLISSLARRRAPGKLMLIGTYRPVEVTLAKHPLKAVKQDLLVHQLCREIALEPLAEAEVAEYLQAESENATVPEGLAGLIYRHTEGNPLFMVAALDHMRNRGLIAVENGTWQIKVPLEKIELEVPESLRQMIEMQIERLSAEEQRVLEALSVLRKFPLSVAVGAAVADIDPETLEGLLEGLARRHQVIRPAGFRNYPDGPSPCYEFVHVLYREVLYQQIGHARRRKLHQSVAESVTALHILHETDLAPELAYQFEEGGDWLRAVKHLLSAADTSGRRFEPRQAAVILEHALELVHKIPEAERSHTEIEALQKLATIYSSSFDPRTLEIYEALAARAAHYGLGSVEALALLEMAMPLANFAGLDRYMRTLDRVNDVLSRSSVADNPKQTWLRALYLARRIGAGKWDPGDLVECANVATKFREAGERQLLGRIQLGLGYALLFFSKYREAHRSAEEGLAILLEGYGENPYLGSHYQAYEHLISECLLYLGEWGEALRQIEKRVGMVEKNGDRQSAIIAGLERVKLQVHALDFAGAQRALDSALAVVSPIPNLHRWWLIRTGVVEVGLGNHDRALDCLVTCKKEMGEHPLMTDWYECLPLQLALTDAWLAKGEFEKAHREAEYLLKASLATEEHTWRALAFDANTRVAIAEQDLDRAQEFIAKALQAMEGFEAPLVHWRVHATAAELNRRSGKRSLAERHQKSSCTTIMRLVNSLPAGESLREIFLSAPIVREILGQHKIPSLLSKEA